MSEKIKVVKANVFKNGAHKKTIFVPIEAIASIELNGMSNRYSIVFKKDYDFGFDTSTTSIEATISESNIDLLS